MPPLEVVPPGDDGGNVDDRLARRLAERRRSRLALLWAAGIAGIAAVLLVLPVVSTLQPDYYRRYPALGQRMDHWAVSTHSRISCVECHIEPGIPGFFGYAAQAVPAFYSQMLRGANDSNLLKPPSRAACRKCHTSYRTVSPGGDLKIPHKAHVEVLGMECVTCHKDLVHSLNRRGFNRPDMKTCLTCHDGDKASDKCMDCHTQKQTPETHTKPDWLQVHGAAAQTGQCATCHDWTPDYCADCHRKKPASHAGNWKQEHGPAAKLRDGGCIVCHGGERFCKTCH